jgi:hypothetical protein
MSLRKRVQKRESERMSDISFRLMSITFNVVDFLYPYIDTYFPPPLHRGLGGQRG